jgi:drug/metabolite transporter (DMT)-like permease
MPAVYRARSRATSTVRPAVGWHSPGRGICTGTISVRRELCWSAAGALCLVARAGRGNLGAMSTAATRTRTHLYLALAAVYVIWGSTYLAMRIAVETLPPMLMGAGRFVLAGALLGGLARVTGTPWPRPRQWLAAVPIGALLFVGGNGLVALAETEVSSGLAALVCATMPLWMAAFAALAGERPQAREWLGIALGLAGVGLLVGGAELSATPTATAILCGSPLAWALGSLLARRWSVGAGLHAAAAPMLTGGVCLLIAALARGETWPAAPSARSLAAWVYLLVLGSLVAFSAYAWLLKHARPAVATSYAFVNPVLAVLLGVVLAGEPLTAATAIAAPLVIAAVVLVTARPRPRPTAPAAPVGATPVEA